MNKQGIVKSISTLFPTEWHSATKFGVKQVLISIAMSSFCGINRICKIASFTGDGLVCALLKLDKAINENAISATLKKLGQGGACKLQMLLLTKNSQWLEVSGLESVTMDTDSTVKSVCGNQQGAAKGFNSTKIGAKSYHPQLVFVSEMKLLYYTWFRTGSAYTAHGIVDFLKEAEVSLPKNIAKYEMNNKIHETGYKNKPLTEQQKKSNNGKSKTRARVEHVFGFMEQSMNGLIVRSVGIKRATGIIGLINLTYNLFRFE